MSAKSVQALRDGYAALARGDPATIASLLDANIEWDIPDSLPFGGTRRGLAEVAAFFAELIKHFPDLHVEPLQFIDGGDTIIVFTRTRATGAAGNIDQTVVHVWRMRDNRATSYTEFADTARVLQALGHEVAPHTQGTRH